MYVRYFFSGTDIRFPFSGAVDFLVTTLGLNCSTRRAFLPSGSFHLLANARNLKWRTRKISNKKKVIKMKVMELVMSYKPFKKIKCVLTGIVSSMVGHNNLPIIARLYDLPSTP